MAARPGRYSPPDCCATEGIPGRANGWTGILSGGAFMKWGRWSVRPLILLAALALAAAACNMPPLGKSQLSAYDGGDGLATVGGGTITPGSQQTGTLESLFEAHNWSFNGQEGQEVTIWAKGHGAANPRIKLIDPDGAVVAQDNDSGGGPRGTDALLVVTLRASGSYTIRVDMFDTGQYTLILE